MAPTMGSTRIFGPFRFEAESLELYRGGRRVEMPLRAAALLACLLERPGDLVTRERLLAGVWGETHVTASSLTEAMSRLRGALGDSATRPRYVETLAGRGYRFVGTVRRRALVSASAAGQRGLRIAAALLASVLSVAAWWLPSRSPAPPPVIVELSASGEVIETVELPPLDLTGLTPSPDGRRLAFQAPRADSGADIWVFDRDERSLRRLSEGGHNAEVIWSPDGSSLTWASSLGGTYDVVRRRADATGELERLVAGPADEYPEAWSADATRLVYSEVGARGDLDLKWLRRDPGGREWHSEPLVVTRAHEYLASLSPDGRWLAYVSNASAGWRVYLADLERGGRPQVVGAGQDPFWSADGAALFFLQAGRLAAVRPPERGVSDLTTLGDLPALERIVRARALGSGGFIAALSG